MVEVLGFKRRRARIDLRLRQAIQQWRGQIGARDSKTPGR